MKLSALKTALLALLLLVPTASRLRASGDPPPAPQEKKKKIVVASPEREIVVDPDRVFVWNDGEDPEMLADLTDLDEEDLPGVVRFRGHGERGYIGVRPIEMTPELRQHFGAPREAGILVGTVEAGSPAAKAGLQVGDIVIAIDGGEIGSTRALARAVRHKKEGDQVKVDLLRDRAARTLTVSVAERKDTEMMLGDLDNGVRGFRWKHFDHGHPGMAPVPPVPPAPPVPPVPPAPPGRGNLQNRLDDLEQRLKDLEGRLKSQ